MRISDWSSDVCSSDLDRIWVIAYPRSKGLSGPILQRNALPLTAPPKLTQLGDLAIQSGANWPDHPGDIRVGDGVRSEEHTSERQSLMRRSSAVISLQKKTRQ